MDWPTALLLMVVAGCLTVVIGIIADLIRDVLRQEKERTNDQD